MALRKASSYSRKYARPNTRVSRKKSRSYVKVVPHNKIVKYTMGTPGKYPFLLKLITTEGVQVRDNALEACRMILTKQMDKGAPGDFCLKIIPYPHHIVRENKSAGGMAGADRISTGMTQSFGVAIGRSALVKAGKSIAEIGCANEKAVKVARAAMAMSKAKLPSKMQVVFERTP